MTIPGNGSQTIGVSHLRHWIERYRDAINERADELNRLDAALGDGDYGASMQRGLQAAVIAMEDVDTDSAGEPLKTAGMALVSTMGGTSGPLVGTLFLRMGASLDGVAEVDTTKLAAALRAGSEGIVALGQAEPGDKTMIDGLLPGIEALESVIGAALPDALAAAAKAAATGAEATREMKARRGRASYVAGGGVGFVDPGATGMSILFEALAAACSTPKTAG